MPKSTGKRTPNECSVNAELYRPATPFRLALTSAHSAANLGSELGLGGYPDCCAASASGVFGGHADQTVTSYMEAKTTNREGIDRSDT